MSKDKQRAIDPFVLAERGQSRCLRIQVSELKRLSSLVRHSQGAIEANLKFGVDEQGIRYIAGTIKGEVAVQCQRCMEDMPLVLDVDVSVAIVRTDEQANRVPEGYEPCIVDRETLSLFDLVEDELILSLPDIAKHPEGVCSSVLPSEAELTSQSPGRENPFAVLADLKLAK